MNRILSFLAISIMVCATSCTPALSEESTAKTVILPGMPGLEWMTENLSGFGGTEVDGRTYYTWEEAMAAAEQLGDGWRLPTRDEFVQLDELGSTWVEDGPHGLPGRLFGGRLFLGAAGDRSLSTGAVAYVGKYGGYWSSFTTTANPLGAGCLNFGADVVNPLGYDYRTYGSSVRCVRDVE